MAAHALRFAHVGQVRIDAPLAGVGWLPDAARRIAEDAPIAAWERTVELCIDREVDFLLLTPRTIASELCAGDRAALLAGFQRLNEFEIPIYWALAPGEPACDGLPDNVSILTESNGTASVIREGRVAATISLGQLDRPPEAVAGPDQPLRIRIAHETADTAAAFHADRGSFHYVACWGGARERVQTIGAEVWSDAGSPLNRTADESGGGAINLVEWVPGRIPEVLRAPTAVVQWQSCLLGLSHETTPDELTERMQLALLEREAAIGEQLWLIEWHIVGAGPEFDRLQSAAARQELEEAVEQVLGGGDRLRRVHRWEFRRPAGTLNDAVSQRVLDWLATQSPPECASIAEDMAASLQQAGAAELSGLLAGLQVADVRADAEQLLAEWLVSMPAASTGMDSTAVLDGGAARDGV